MGKKKLTDDQAEMLAFFAEKGVFEEKELLNFLSHFALWDEKYKRDTFFDLRSYGLISVQREEFTPSPGKTPMDRDFTIAYKAFGYHVTEDAKVLLKNYQEVKARKLRKKKLKDELLLGSVRTNRITWISVGTTIFLTGIIVWLQIRTDNREQRREQRELHKELQDSLTQLQQSKHDSLYENYLLRKVQEVSNFSKIDSANK